MLCADIQQDAEVMARTTFENPRLYYRQFQAGLIYFYRFYRCVTIIIWFVVLACVCVCVCSDHILHFYFAFHSVLHWFLLCTLVSTILYEFDAFISLTHYIADLRWKLRYCFCNLWLVASDVTRHSPIGSIKKSLMSPLLSAKLWLGDILNMRAGSEVMAAKVVSVVYVGIFSKSIVVRQIQA